ncbi:hypothetical protein Tco_0138902 [Tanacetum coccineum]
MNEKDLSKQVALDLVRSAETNRGREINGREESKKAVALIRFVWRVKENGRSEWLCFIDQWKSALRTRLSKDVSGCYVMMTCSTLDRLVCVINRRRGNNKRKEIKVLLSRQEENGETTRREHYGGRSSNPVALDVAGEEVVETNLDVTEVEVGCPEKVENQDGSKVIKAAMSQGRE